MEILRPKELDTHPGEEILAWARGQLNIARSILDNPGGGLLFAPQTIGQVRAGSTWRGCSRGLRTRLCIVSSPSREGCSTTRPPTFARPRRPTPASLRTPSHLRVRRKARPRAA